MRKLLFLALGAIMFTQFACKSGSGDTTKHGHRFVNHTEKSGPKCNYNDVVEVNVNTWLNDSLVQSTARDMGGPQVLTLPDTAAFKNKAKFPALFDVLFEMTEGDSSTVGK